MDQEKKTEFTQPLTDQEASVAVGGMLVKMNFLWKCEKCNRTNSSAGTCSCGGTRRPAWKDQA